MSQFVEGSAPVDRILSFVNIEDRIAHGLALVLKKELKPYNLEKKLITQS
jgi:hypothetical protein